MTMQAAGVLKSVSWLNPASLLSRSGVKFKLQLAFAAAALMTVVASAVAIVSFRSIESNVQRVAQHQVPLMTEALRLSVMSGEISAAAARFVSASNVRDQRAIASHIEDRSIQLRTTIDRLRGDAGKASFGAVETASRLMESNLSDLDTVIMAKSNLRLRLDKKLETLHRVHSRIAEELTPIVDKSYFEVVTRADKIGRSDDGRPAKVEELVNTYLNDFRNALELKIRIHLMASLLSDGSIAKDETALLNIVARFEESINLILFVAQSLKNDDIRKSLDEFFELGRAEENIFALRRQEISVTAGAVRVIEDNVKIQKQLDEAVSALVRETETAMTGGTSRLLDELAWDRMLLIAVALASLLAAAAIAYFYVQRSLIRRLTGLGACMRRLSAGDNAVEVAAAKDQDELGEMGRALVVFRDAAVEKLRLEAQSAEDRRLADEERRRNEAARAEAAVQVRKVVEGLGRGLERLARGDLTYRVREDWAGEYRKIQDDFNGAIDQLHETLKSIAESTREVSNAASEISASTTDLSQRTEEQAASLEETSASMEEIAATVKKNAENARHADTLTRETRAVADRGGQVVSEAVSAMARIEESSRRIADIISVIDEIARQTNLLALNAAVEAARAGEAGRGFAVVASEVRSLAQRSSQAAKDIKELITDSSGQVQDGVALVNKAGQSLAEITQSVRQVADIVADIANASSEQASGLDQITRALSQMDEVTQQNSALVEENAATAKTLEDQQSAMSERVGFFRFAHTGEAAGSDEADPVSGVVDQLRAVAARMHDAERAPAARRA
jgi:methyl-accepting chemotaxis protein